MKINILKKGDKVLSVTNDLIAVQRKNGEVDIIPLMLEKTGPRVNEEGIVTIGYGDNTVEISNGDVLITKF